MSRSPGHRREGKMTRLSAYGNEIVSFIVMLLLIVALVAGQVGATEHALAPHVGDENAVVAETSHIRLENE
jgi:hypothetical protein